VVDGEERLKIPSGGTHESVGEAVVSVVPRVEDNLFKYMTLSHARASPIEDLPPGLGVVPPDFGSAERGAFSYVILVPQQPGIAAVGIYFREGRLGVLYAPLRLDAPRLYTKVELGAFVELVAMEHSLQLGGFG
jgi:hypothetical protein